MYAIKNNRLFEFLGKSIDKITTQKGWNSSCKIVFLPKMTLKCVFFGKYALQNNTLIILVYLC